jgi:hypothetical protein
VSVDNPSNEIVMPVLATLFPAVHASINITVPSVAVW